MGSRENFNFYALYSDEYTAFFLRTIHDAQRNRALGALCTYTIEAQLPEQLACLRS